METNTRLNQPTNQEIHQTSAMTFEVFIAHNTL